MNTIGHKAGIDWLNPKAWFRRTLVQLPLLEDSSQSPPDHMDFSERMVSVAIKVRLKDQNLMLSPILP
jgi:hypothetical protein